VPVTREVLEIVAFLMLLLGGLCYGIYHWRVWARHRDMWEALNEPAGDHGAPSAWFWGRRYVPLKDPLLTVAGDGAKLFFLLFLLAVFLMLMGTWFPLKR
jgi:hypothetical protein